MKPYIVISGTGRAGTTLLMRILTRLDLDTGYDAIRDFNLNGPHLDLRSKAGLERDLRDLPPCEIIKSPWLATYIAEVTERTDLKIKHAILCMRSLNEAAESRRRVQSLYGHSRLVPGGLWLTDAPEGQEQVLSELFYDLVYFLSKADIPVTFIHFPRFAIDPDYLFTKLQPIFPTIMHEAVAKAHETEVRSEWISDIS